MIGQLHRLCLQCGAAADPSPGYTLHGCRRLDQMAPAHRSIGDASVQAAIQEAEALLSEVRTLSV